jgi:hypothetical protein
MKERPHITKMSCKNAADWSQPFLRPVCWSCRNAIVNHGCRIIACSWYLLRSSQIISSGYHSEDVEKLWHLLGFWHSIPAPTHTNNQANQRDNFSTPFEMCVHRTVPTADRNVGTLFLGWFDYRNSFPPRGVQKCQQHTVVVGYILLLFVLIFSLSL